MSDDATPIGQDEVEKLLAQARDAAASGAPPTPPPAASAAQEVGALDQSEIEALFQASSAAPVYPPELSARGTEGQVEAEYVVDIAGRVDTTTIRVMRSDHPRFAESVRAALAEARFRPATRGGKAVRQLVAQRFRFKQAQGLASP